jgi:ubiquitin C
MTSNTLSLVKTFPIFIKGIDSFYKVININSENTIADIINMIDLIDPRIKNEIRFVFHGKSLSYDKTISYYNINTDDTIYMVLRLRGGMFHQSSGRDQFNNLII